MCNLLGLMFLLPAGAKIEKTGGKTREGATPNTRQEMGRQLRKREHQSERAVRGGKKTNQKRIERELKKGGLGLREN